MEEGFGRGIKYGFCPKKLILASSDETVSCLLFSPSHLVLCVEMLKEALLGGGDERAG